MKKFFTLLIFALSCCISQEQISFAETTNIFIKEQTYYRPVIELYSSGASVFLGSSFDPKNYMKSFTDETGNNASYDKLEISWLGGKPIDVNKEGSSGTVSYKYRYGDGNDVEERLYVEVFSDQTKAELKDVNLYIDQEWDIFSVMKDVTDMFGTTIESSDEENLINKYLIDGEETKKLDTSKPGKHTVQIALENAYGKLVYSNEVTVTVEDKTKAELVEDKTKAELVEDKTKAELKDTELYVGQKWDLGSVYKNVVDKDGNPISVEQIFWVEIDGEWIDLRENKQEELIDTSKPGKHIVRVAVRNANGPGSDTQYAYSNPATVTVKEDKTKAELKDTELYVGQKWDLGSVYKNVVDKDGNPISVEQIFWVEIGGEGNWIDLRENKREELIDTSKPGKHIVRVAVRNANGPDSDTQYAYSNPATVTVKEEPFMIKHVSDFDFGEKELSLTNKLVANKKENPTIEVETPSIVGKDWQLQVELSPFLDKENSKSILKGVSLFIPKGKLESDLETEEPTQYDCQLEANGKASILMHGTKIKGKGRWKNKLATKGITLSIPPENKTGNYESTLHWTLLDVPG
ncbi:WxL domain-containing protein [Enterococcus faecalis]